MSYEVIAPLVVLGAAVTDSNDESGNAGPRYFYQGAVIPDGFNDERCKELVKDKMLEVVSADAAADPNKVPAKSASKADWVSFATAEERGDARLTEEDANAATRDDLAELFSPKA